MWLIKIITIINLDIILNLINNNLLELMILNRQNFSGFDTTINGIRATQISFTGDIIRDFDFDNLDFQNMILITLNFVKNELFIIKLNQQDESDENEFSSSNEDFDDYISDEDFTFNRYEWSNSDFNYDDTDWSYNSP